MDVQKAIEIGREIIKSNNEIVKQTRANKDTNAMQLTANCDRESLAIETLINVAENSILTEVIEEKIDRFKDTTIWGYNDWKYDETVYKAELNIIDRIKKALLENK